MNIDTSAIEAEICSRLWEGGGYKLKSLLPNYNFTERGAYLQSACYLNGAEGSGRQDKTKIGRGKSNKDSLVIFEQGGAEYNLIYWLIYEHYGYSTSDKSSYWEGLKKLGSFTGVEIGTEEEIKAYREKQEKELNLQSVMNNILAKARTELYTEEGKEVLKYVEGRGYGKEFIEYAQLGAITSTVKSQLEAFMLELPEGSGKNTLKFFLYAEQANYKLVFPYVSIGGTIGLIFRSVCGAEKLEKIKEETGKHCPKYLCFFPIEGKTTSGFPFGLDAELDCSKPVVIAEGGLDCLTARFYGISNIIAVWGTFFNDNNVKAIQRKGVKAVTLFFDTDNSEEKQQAIFDKMLKHSQLLESYSIKTYFAKLEGRDGEKIDIDSYLTAGGSVEGLKSIISNANSFHYMQAKTLLDRYNSSEHTAFDRSCLLKDLTEFLCRESLKEVERAEVMQLLATEAGESYRDIMTIRTARARRGKIEKQIAEAVNKKDYSQLEGLLPRLDGKTSNKQLSKAVVDGLKARPKTAVDWRKQWSKVGEEIITSYIFQKPDGKGEDILTLPVKALTLVGGYTSHGKSTFLQNIALNLLEERRVWTQETGEIIAPPVDGRVIYFSLEESREDTEQKLLNTFVGVDFSGNNRKALKHYYKALDSGEAEAVKYFTGNAYNTDAFLQNYKTFKEKEEIFINHYLLTGRLTVIDSTEVERKTAGNIMAILEEILQEGKIGAVFVDFQQEIEAEDSHSQNQQKRLELKDITGAMKDFAEKYNLPFICAVQLNRATDSPFTLSVKNIAESADIERYCNKAILLYNSAFPVTKERAGGYYLQLLKTAKKDTTGAEAQTIEATLTEQAKALQKRGWKAEQAGALYAVLAKNRGGVLYSNAVLTFEGNTGRVRPESLVREVLQQREAEQAKTFQQKIAQFQNKGGGVATTEQPSRPLTEAERAENVSNMLDAIEYTTETEEDLPF